MIDKPHTLLIHQDDNMQNLQNEGLLNNRERVSKRSEQMKKRLDKLSGHDLIATCSEVNNCNDQDSSTPTKKKNQKNKNFSMHRSTTSIIGYDSEKGVVYEAADYLPSSSIDYSSPVKKLKIIENSKKVDASPQEELNISNFDSSFNTLDVDIGEHFVPATENQRIIESNSLFQKPNSSFIPIKNNLALINLQKETSNVTDSYYMALYGEKSEVNQKSINNKDVLSSDIIEEEESFRESDLQTPKNERIAANPDKPTPQSLSLKWNSKSNLSVTKPCSLKRVFDQVKLNTEGNSNYNKYSSSNTESSNVQLKHTTVAKYENLNKKSQTTTHQFINKYHKENVNLSSKSDLILGKSSNNQYSSKEVFSIKKTAFKSDQSKLRVKTNHSKSDGKQVSETLHYLNHSDNRENAGLTHEEGNTKPNKDITRALNFDTKQGAKSLTKIRHKYESSFSVSQSFASTLKKFIQNENSISSETSKCNTKVKSKSIEKNSSKSMKNSNLTFPNPPSTKSLKQINPQLKECSKFGNKPSSAATKSKDLKFKIVQIKHSKIKHDSNYFMVAHLSQASQTQTGNNALDEKNNSSTLPSVSFRGTMKTTSANEDKTMFRSHKYSSSAKS